MQLSTMQSLHDFLSLLFNCDSFGCKLTLVTIDSNSFTHGIVSKLLPTTVAPTKVAVLFNWNLSTSCTTRFIWTMVV